MTLAKTPLLFVMCSAQLSHPVPASREQPAVDGFNSGADSWVYAVAVQPDGKILVGGFFKTPGGGTGTTTRNRIGRTERRFTGSVAYRKKGSAP